MNFDIVSSYNSKSSSKIYIYSICDIIQEFEGDTRLLCFSTMTILTQKKKRTVIFLFGDDYFGEYFLN